MEAPQRPPLHPSFYQCAPVILEQRMKLFEHGYVFVGPRKVGVNDDCPCQSKRKFKNCCVPNVIRKAGATWLLPEAQAESRRKL